MVVNKIDRPSARPEYVVDKTFDLFCDLNANDMQSDFQASAINILGVCCRPVFVCRSLQEPFWRLSKPQAFNCPRLPFTRPMSRYSLSAWARPGIRVRGGDPTAFICLSPGGRVAQLISYPRLVFSYVSVLKPPRHRTNLLRHRPSGIKRNLFIEAEQCAIVPFYASKLCRRNPSLKIFTPDLATLATFETSGACDVGA